MTSFVYEERHAGPVAGVDEAGCGPWAGPVVAAAIILDRCNFPAGLDDSKKLSPAARQQFFDTLIGCARYGIGIVSVAEIDSLNIYRATMLAMDRAVGALGCSIAHVLVDGKRLPQWPHPATAIVKGDGISASIAAASIIAKVTRDRLMIELDAECPGYGWADNKGYGTAAHQRGLARMGVTPHHRRSFAPIRALL